MQNKDDATLDPLGAADDTTLAAKKPSRRTFIGVMGAVSAVGTVATKLQIAYAQVGAGAPSDARSEHDRRLDEEHVRRSTNLRIEAAKRDASQPLPPLPTNGDEERYDNKIGTDTRALPHDENGEVLPAAWALAAKAYASRKWEDFEKIPLGGVRKQVNALGTLAGAVTGLSSPQFAIPPAPALASAQKGTEAIELYWQALLRDVPFHEYGTHPLALEAAEELSKHPEFTGPRVDGKVTPDVLFRGSVTYVDPSDPSGRTPKHVVPQGALIGPYLSQFLFRDIPYGATYIPSSLRLPTAGRDNDFQTKYDEWLSIQNGANPARSIKFDGTRRRVHTGRDLAEYVHGGSPSFWGASLTLGAANDPNLDAASGFGAPLSPTNPYLKLKTQAAGSGSFALAYLQGLLNLAQSYAIRAEYWQKWFVHRHLRAEAYGGLVHNQVENGRDYPLHDNILSSKALAHSFSKWGNYLLPQAFPEGAPIHSAYPGGNASISSVSVTLLKAFFDESYVIPNPVQPDPKDPTKLIPYVGPPLTVGGELDKFALNNAIGRNWAGIHWRTDAAAAFAVGERLALSILRTEARSFQEPFEGWTLTKFDGTKVKIS